MCVKKLHMNNLSVCGKTTYTYVKKLHTSCVKKLHSKRKDKRKNKKKINNTSIRYRFLKRKEHLLKQSYYIQILIQ